jgi:vancomycin resistance protein YoaR
MRRIWIIAFSAVSIVAVVALGLAVVNARLAYQGRVAPQVYAANVSLSNLAAPDAVAAINEYEQELLYTAEFLVDGQLATLDPGDIGLRIDSGPVVQAALAQRPSEGLIADINNWFEGYTRIDLDVPIRVDMVALELLFDDWDRRYVNRPPHDGGIVIEGATAVPDYPQPGLAIDREAARAAIIAALASPQRTTTSIPLAEVPPLLDEADIDAAVVAVNLLIDTDVVLRLPDGTQPLIYNQAQLVASLSSLIEPDSATRLKVELNPDALRGKVQGTTAYDHEPVSARFEFSEEDQAVSLVAGSPATTLDVEGIPDAVLAAALGDGTGLVPILEGEPAEFTTAQAEAMGPITKLSEFTTRHSCCANRTVNIRKLADEIDGALVWPGQLFSVNDHAGPRTREEGYVAAGAIIAGKLHCCDSPFNIGGGTSQFATTFYNAVFFSCLEDVDHKPHSIYFSRYPFGREATMGYPQPDVVFRNDSESIVYIDTSHTGNSITVAFYGNHDGRECSALSRRRGNTVTTTRVITYPDGTFKREPFTWTYREISR